MEQAEKLLAGAKRVIEQAILKDSVKVDDLSKLHAGLKVACEKLEAFRQLAEAGTKLGAPRWTHEALFLCCAEATALSMMVDEAIEEKSKPDGRLLSVLVKFYETNAAAAADLCDSMDESGKLLGQVRAAVLERRA